jgi:hypothetical protein
MRGYLSRIAMQSGLRVSGRDKRLVHGTGEADGTRPGLHRKEVVMISPCVNTMSTGPGILKCALSPEQKATETAVTQQGQSKKGPAIIREIKAAPKVYANPTAYVPKASDPAGLQPAQQPTMNSLSYGKSFALNAVETEQTKVETTVYVKPLASPAQHEIHSLNAGDTPTSPKQSAKQEDKHYFSETTEIIAGRHAEPVEVQTILLRELQEWVAAGTMAKPSAGETDRSVESVATGTEQVEPGVIRIGERRHREYIPREALRIEEHSLNLSIGTISVVIENDERPTQSAPVPRVETGSICERQVTRRHSRLSRNYL